MDENDNILGYESKLNAHRGGGLLHRAFSIFIFSGPDRVLLHRRSEQKLLWPGFWTNSCCSHPRHGESYAYAARRRLREELGVCTELAWLYQFQYAARFRDEGSEHELCAVMIGDIDERRRVAPNRQEVLDWDWFDCSAVDAWITKQPEQFTPWFKLEWARLRGDQLGKVTAFCQRRRLARRLAIH